MLKNKEYIYTEDDRICHDYDNLSKDELIKLLKEQEEKENKK